MKAGVLIGFLLCLAGLTGCEMSLPSKETPPPAFFGLDYEPAPVECRKGFQEGVRVWDFTAAEPFDRRGMVVLKEGNEVAVSDRHLWVALPGALLAESLRQELTESPLFSLAVDGMSRIETPLELGGNINHFAWRETGKGRQAVLEVDVRLWRTMPTRKVLFRETYRLTGETSSDTSSSAFAKAMSELAAGFSKALRRDLCSIASARN